MSEEGEVYEGVSISKLAILLQECELKLVQSTSEYILLNHNKVEVYNSILLTDIYTYSVGYLIEEIGNSEGQE